VALLHRAETRPMTHAPRVGLCGLLGAGNLGNDGSRATIAVGESLLSGRPERVLR
jgi:hypothetical protein